MAKVIEDVIVIKISKIVRDDDKDQSVVDDDVKEAIASTVPTLLDEIINDKSIIVELADIS